MVFITNQKAVLYMGSDEKCALCDDGISYYCNMNDLYYCEKHVVGHDENET